MQRAEADGGSSATPWRKADRHHQLVLRRMERRVRRCQDGLHFGHCVTGSSRSSPVTCDRSRSRESHKLFLGTAACGLYVRMLRQCRDTSGYEGGPKSTHIPKTFPSDQLVDPNPVALRGLALPESGAGDGNRTHGSSLGSLGITIIRRPPPRHCSPMLMRAAITAYAVRRGLARGTG